MAYPIYLTIGNVPKQIRRKVSCHAQILLGYIPPTKLLGISNKAGRRRALANLFHACMRDVLGPISSYGETGLEMMSGDGVWRRCHPIFATFVGDYPEQGLVTCTYYGRCPKCTVPPNQLGEYESFPPRVQSGVLDTYGLADGDIHAFHLACRVAGMKPIYHPFWETLPLTDIFFSITPDILHQMLQGMVKHIVSWLVHIFGAAAINARCHAIPPNHNLRIFMKGITSLAQVSGSEHKKICKFLLGLVIDLPVPGGQGSVRITRAVRALMDFLYLAQYESHTSDTISLLQDSLTRFHDNKDVFLDLGIRENFRLPKLHSLTHYASSIQLFGTTDNYNTEQSERLHIDFAKNAYRATNHKDEYSQMTKWLERREKIEQHSALINWRHKQGTEHHSPSQEAIGPPRAHVLTLKMAQRPSKRGVLFNDLARDYGAPDFQDALADFIAQVNYPGASGTALRHRAHNTHIPFSGVPVYHYIKFTKGAEIDEFKIVDVVHVRPEQKDLHGRIIPGRFDTVLVDSRGLSGPHGQGNRGRRIAQVRTVFEIPQNKIDDVFPSPDTRPPTYLAYVEWFSPVPTAREPNHLMFKVSRSTQGGRRSASIIPVDSIVRSVHLIPRFGSVTPSDWSTFNVLDNCKSFYINPFTDIDSYITFA
jgi:Plavaka transposase